MQTQRQQITVVCECYALCLWSVALFLAIAKLLEGLWTDLIVVKCKNELQGQEDGQVDIRETVET